MVHLDYLSPSKESRGGNNSTAQSSRPVSNADNVEEMPCYGKKAKTKQTVSGRDSPQLLVSSPVRQGSEMTRQESATTSNQASMRARLYLEVRSPGAGSTDSSNMDSASETSTGSEPMDTAQSSDSDSGGQPFHCPLCAWSTNSSAEIQHHVNFQHVDILSPANPRGKGLLQGGLENQNDINIPSTSSSGAKELFECPLCGLHTHTANALEVHVNIKHKDILSPEDGMLRAPIAEIEEDDSHCCPVCGMEFACLASLTAHVDGHFSAAQTPVNGVADNALVQDIERKEKAAQQSLEQKEFERLQAQYGMDGKNSYKKQSQKNLEKAVCDGQMSITEYYNRLMQTQESSVTGVDDGHSCTKGIIARLRDFYAKPSSTKAWLCSSVDHFAASYGDKGWGCGYRNLQMLLSSLAACSLYQDVLFNGRPIIPSIPKIQRLIETAWQKGFDLQGSEQLGGKLFNTTKWIGATEIVATLSSLKVKCQLLDFHAPTGPDGTHPKLFEWVRDYFKKTADFKPPLYLQHQGHSRTIVGVEETKDSSLRLLLFDPSLTKKQMHQFHGEINANLMRSLRRTPLSMKAKQYQIVAVVGILNEKEYQENKIMKSERIP
ncbi:zinc finger with UFM1-specific peptidase domain protein [Lingula anatina]|uniref:Zinc finger-containing ubiquitin peptidase 1 n=1 Tax=Lingula anatina TaxID=7574 RepID=A0A2R2MMT1_LINAN|nr:zinc finger with UFM1-specific peptidase domain protein [Lingula anatina]|eukprot:XP_023931543.1 zinc finger with UFM1-specific peptidase domain protein [Lingula anatina]